MSMLQFIAGTTANLIYDFYTTAGVHTTVLNPIAKIYTPEHQEYSSVSLTAQSGVTGQYYYNFGVPSAGLTIGHWSTIGVGFTNNSTMFTFVQPFEIVDFTQEPFFIGVQILRDYLEIPDTDHTKDELYKRILAIAVSLVEQYLQRKISVHNISETFHVQHSSNIILKDYPVVQINGMTMSYLFSGAVPSAPNTSSITTTSSTDEFFFHLRKDAGVLQLIDDVGTECIYRDFAVEIDYKAGYLQIPQSIIGAILMLASGILNVSQSEGLQLVRFSELSFTFSKGLFTQLIQDALIGFKRVSFSQSR